MKRKIEECVEIVDVTSVDDDPYDDWDVKPFDKFIMELLENGYTYEEIYSVDICKESGIMVEYNLFPGEILKWDDEEKNMKLKVKYTPLLKFRNALVDLGINYDRKYWK